jgi:hypothetical protein
MSRWTYDLPLIAFGAGGIYYFSTGDTTNGLLAFAVAVLFDIAGAARSDDE